MLVTLVQILGYFSVCDLPHCFFIQNDRYGNYVIILKTGKHQANDRSWLSAQPIEAI